MKPQQVATLILVTLGSLGLTTACAAPQRGDVQTPAAYPPPGPPVGTAHPPTAGVPYCSEQFQSQFGWDDPGKAARVCQCESSGNPRARSRNGLYMGLFQFSADAWHSAGGGDPFDPWLNSHHARTLWSKKGWRPWPHCGRK